MPRIDPLQLLKCLSVLLTPEGGILSREEVPRLVNLMTKFSKKLVSKCVYVLILKSTETELVDLFMGEGGWSLIQTWLQDAVQTSNWDLVREILGLLLVTPVDVERLKLNILPKLIKSLSRREDLEGVAQLSTQLVQQWLMIVKGTAGQIQQQQVQAQSQPQLQSIARKTSESEDELKDIVSNKNVKSEKVELKSEVLTEEGSDGISPGLFYKTSGKDGKLVIKKLDENNARKEQDGDTADDTESSEDRRDVKDKGKIKSKSSKSSSSSSKSRSGGKDENKSIKDSDKEKDKDRRKSSSSSSKSSSHSSSKYSSSSKSRDEKDKDRHRDRDKVRDKSKDSDKDRHRSNGSLKSSSSSKSSKNKDKKSHRDKDRESARDKSKHDDKDKQAEKDNNTLEKLKPPTIDKLGRIPKKTPSVDEKTNDAALDMKKKSFSVGIRKDKENEERPKTVKVFNSKMRSTGLEEEVKPAPPRTATGSKKPTPSVQLPTIPQKRPSPPKDLRDPIVPPEKKLKMDKIEGPERPGAIKLIPPKPKRIVGKQEDVLDNFRTCCKGLLSLHFDVGKRQSFVVSFYNLKFIY